MTKFFKIFILLFKFTSKFLFCIVVFIQFTAYGQILEKDLQNTAYEYAQVDEILSDIRLESMQYDELGWLWVSGMQLEANEYKLGDTKPVLLRFNGKSFKPINIPVNNFNKNAIVKLIKKDGNSLYVKFFYKDFISIYELNTVSLKFKKLTLPDYFSNNLKNNELLDSNNSFKYIEQPEGEAEARIYQINANNEFEFLAKIDRIRDLHDVRYIKLPNGFILSNKAIGIRFYDSSGNFIKNLGNLDFNGMDILPEEKLLFTSVFYSNGNIYARLEHYNSYFRYDDKTNTWDKIVINGLILGPSNVKYSGDFSDTKGNILFERVYEGRTELHAYTNLESKPSWTRKLNFEMLHNSIFASRDFSRNFVLKKNDRFLEFRLGSNSIKTFLNAYSIRSFLQLNDDEVLVATDFSGWFKLNLKDGSVVAKKFYIDGGRIPFPVQNRGLYFQDTVIWSNTSYGLLEVNSENFEVKQHLDSLVILSMQQDKKRIVLADGDNNVYEFNKITKQAKIIIAADSLNYQNFIFKDSAIYAATSKGLIAIINNKRILYQPSNIEDRYILSISNHHKLGILLGTKSGKILKFNTETKAFSTLYIDSLGASIASMLFKDDYIWINTFAGIVAYNYNTKETFRLGINDGLSHYECNRYSSLLLESGNLLVGTLRGLNLLNPTKLIKEKDEDAIGLDLWFLSLKYFDDLKNEVVTNYDLSEINNLESITLSPIYNTINIELGVITNGVVNKYDLRYKLNNSEWVYIQNNFELDFTNLAAGKYKLEIQAIDKIKRAVLGSNTLNFRVPIIFYKTLWFVFVVGGVVVFIILIYVRNRNKSRVSLVKNKFLRREVEYKKKDLADFASNISRSHQWNDYLIAKMEEIKVAKGRKKGTALINLEKEIKEKNSILETNFDFQKRIDVLSNEFYNSLIKHYPNLSKTEVKLCSLIRLDLDNYDIATLQNVDVSSIYKSRYRLRKKLNITSDTDLNIFLKSF